VTRTPSRVLAALLLVGVLGGCALKHPVANLVRGKQLFVAKCGFCHTLSHAATTGTIGPNLDDAFRQDRADGVKSTSIQGLVDYWVRYPDSGGVMPANCAKKSIVGTPFCLSAQEAQDVAAYVGLVAAIPGQDTGTLANALVVTGTSPSAGEQVFKTNSCASCHTLAAAGASGTVGPNLDTRLRSDCASPASKKIRGPTLADCIHTAIVDPYKFIPSGYAAGVMPSTFGTTLKPNEITALINFLSTAAK
jgi:cytochrome c2